MFLKYLKNLLYTNTFLAAILIPLVFPGSVQAPPLSVSEENRAIDDVTVAFNALITRRKE